MNIALSSILSMYAKFEKIYHQEVTQTLIARFETDRETERQTDKQRQRVDKSIGKNAFFVRLQTTFA